MIIGQGNVAADVSRILAKTVDELKHTDIAQHALDCLAASKVRNIYVIGRRGPAQAKFTSKELKEFGELSDCHPTIAPAELQINPESETELADKSNAGSKKIFELFQEYASLPPDPVKSKKCHFTFLKSPVEIQGDGRVSRIILERNRLSGAAFQQSARGTGERVSLDAGIVFRSIGYQGVAMPGVPFDGRKGVIPNDKGRVTDNDGKPILQLYCAGWIKRGPTGIIGTNRADSVATVESLLEDLDLFDSKERKAGSAGIYPILDERGIRHVSFSDWKKIDQHEVERGMSKGKPREKYTRVEEMLALLK